MPLPDLLFRDDVSFGLGGWEGGGDVLEFGLGGFKFGITHDVERV